MYRFVSFILFNIFMYSVYLSIDTVFTFFNWYSNSELGHDITIMPTNSDVWLILINTLFSSILAFYLMYKIKNILE
jgi:hypothetical protein